MARPPSRVDYPVDPDDPEPEEDYYGPSAKWVDSPELRALRSIDRGILERQRREVRREKRKRRRTWEP